MKKTVMLVCVLMCSAAAVSQAQTVLVPDFRVDNGSAGVYACCAAVQAINQDRFAIVWLDNRNGSYQPFASIYSNGGGIIRDDYRIDDGVAGSNFYSIGAGGITEDTNGNFFVTWRTTNDFVTYLGRIRKFLPNGDPSGASVNASEFGGDGTSQVFHVARGANDKIIVSYIGPGGFGGSIYYRIFDNDLVPITTSIQVNQTQPGSTPAIASDFAGNFVLAWKQYDVGSGLDGRMRARLYDSNGNPRTDEFAIETFMSGADYPQVVYNKDGHFIVVWWAGGTYAMGRIFDENGNPLSNVFYLGPLLPSPPEQYGKPSVDADDNGNFIITYEYSSLSEPKRIYGTIYDTSGLLMEVFFPVSEITIGIPFNVMETDVACLSGGRFVTTWRDGRNDSNGDIYAAILQNDHWVPQPPGNGIPSAGPLALAILAVVLATILIRSLKSRERKTSV